MDNLCHDGIWGEDKHTSVTLMQQIHQEWIPEFVEKYVKTSRGPLVRQESLRHQISACSGIPILIESFA